MADQNVPIVKKYSFEKIELEDLTEINLGIVTFNRAIAGMRVNEEYVLSMAYKRCGIEETREGYDRSIIYNLKENRITVTWTPKPPEKKEENPVSGIDKKE
jgi:hypothetical protein